MTDHMQLQRKTVGSSADASPTPAVMPSAPAPTATLQHIPEPPTQAESASEPAPEQNQEPQSSLLNYDFGRIPILPKLSVSQPNDPYEQEADRMAEQVMRMPEPGHREPVALRQEFAGHDFGQVALRPQLQPLVQRKDAACEEEAKLMRKPNGESISGRHNLENKLLDHPGGGEPLPENIRAFMESRIGFDFSQVRLHTDTDAAEMNQALGAQAFTYGNNIYFNSGKYDPESQSGKELLAHELTHTVQQTGGKTLNQTDQPYEETTQSNKLIQPKAISKASLPRISLKAIPSVGVATPSPTPHLNSSSTEGLLQSLSTTPASSLGLAVTLAKGATAQTQAQEKQSLENNLPEQESSTGLPRQSARPQTKPTALEPGQAPDFKMANGRSEQAVSTQHQAAQGAVPGSSVSTEAAAPDNPGGLLGWLTGRVSSFLKDLPTKDPGLDTSAGERPRVALDGEADPNQSNPFQQESEQEVKSRQRQADQATAENFGEDGIYPTVPIERLRSSYRLTGSPGNEAGQGKHPPHLPEDVRAAFDEHETPKLTPKLQYQLENYRAKEAKHQQESRQIRQEGQNRIDRETSRVRDEQTGFQDQAQSDVNRERQRWCEENQRIQEEYSNQSQAKRRELDQQIQDEADTTDRETDKRLSEAERKAESERERTEREAENKKREAENKPQNFWERTKESISAVFEGIRRSIASLFEGLRQLVRQIIEAAKTVIKALIEAARRVIVALIRGFGEVLKGLVTVALFAFPDVAARAREWIGGRVNTAVERVNEAAAQLKQFTDEALDWIGARLDQALNLLQGAFNVALDVAEFLAVAPLEAMNQLAQIMNWLQENGGLIGGIQRLEQSAAEVEAGAKEQLQGYIDQIPGELEQQLNEESQQVIEAIRPHWDDIWHYVQQDLEHLRNGWWSAIKEMLWTWIWPFHENSPVLQDWPKFTEELANCLKHVREGKYSEAIDSFLTASQLLAGIIDAFSLWFTIAAVIIGAVIGSIVPGPGTAAGAKVGLEVAGGFGTVLSVFSFAAEVGILGKAIYDISTGENTEAENDEDYQAIASSGMAVTTELVFGAIGFLIGAAAGTSIGTKIGHSIASAIVRMLRKMPRIPRPRGVPDLPNGRPTPGTDGGSPGGTDADTPDPGRTPEEPDPSAPAEEPNAPETPGRTPEEPTSPAPDTPEPTRTPDQPHNQSTGDGPDATTPDTTPDRSGDSTQSPDANTRPVDQSSNSRLTDEQLTQGLPPDLQGQVSVRVNPELSGNTVRVYYTRNGDGTVGDIHIEAGPDARRVDIELHAETVRLMQRYSGLSGRIRILKEQIENWIRRNGEPPVGTKAWEAKLEIEKLPRIIDERLERLSRGDLDAQAEADLRADIENLERQLDRHQQTLNEMDTDPGVGFVAADLKGRILGTYDYPNPGPLAGTAKLDKVAASFAGHRYTVIELESETFLYRAGADKPLTDNPLGEFFSQEPPVSAIQVRVDQAVLPVWPNGGKSPLDVVYKVKIPAGTHAYVGEIASQGSHYFGGTEQIVVLEPWTIGAVAVEKYPIKK